MHESVSPCRVLVVYFVHGAFFIENVFGWVLLFEGVDEGENYTDDVLVVFKTFVGQSYGDGETTLLIHEATGSTSRQIHD